MKIAVCLSGQPRTWRHACPTLSAFFAAHEVSAFFHTWDEADPAEVEALVAAYAPRAYAVEARPAFLDEKRRLAARFPDRPPLTTFDMFHSMARSLGLALDADAGGAGFDLICRTRFDLIYDGAWNGAAPPPRSLIAPAGLYGPTGGCNDQFAIGAPDVMRLYAGVSAWLPAGLETLAPPWFRPEIALGHYLTEVCGLSIVRQPLALTLLRESQVGRPFAELQDDLLFHARKHEDWEMFAAANGLESDAGPLSFRHAGQTPLALDRWFEGQPAERQKAATEGPWPARIVAIDALIAEELDPGPLDGAGYGLVRLLCAAVIHRMARDEPMTVEAFVVHALSANTLDRTRAADWLGSDMSRLALMAAALGDAPRLDEAFAFASPFDQPTTMGWRVE